ncbi:MAG: M23 family metallopeptidase [Patescibacteria group bacterium]
MLVENLKAELTRKWYHWPRYPGEQKYLEAIAYLRLPFTKEDLDWSVIRSSQPGITRKIQYEVSEGWWYSPEVTGRLLRPVRHAAVDFRLPYGHPVVAPCEGMAIASYYGNQQLDKNGRPVEFAIGYFVQIFNPDQKRLVQLGHLSNVADTIPFSIPQKVGSRWMPTGYLQPEAEMTNSNNNLLVRVKAGDLMGYVGYSGLCNGPDYFEGYDRPYVTDPNEIGTRSYPHLHMDESRRDYKTAEKRWRRDPYAEYGLADAYPTHSNNLTLREETLFLTDQLGKPKFPGL